MATSKKSSGIITQELFTHGSTKIPYTLKRRAVRSIQIKISVQNGVELSLPLALGKAYADTTILKNLAYIQKKLQQITDYKKTVSLHNNATNTLYFLGKAYLIQFQAKNISHIEPIQLSGISRYFSSELLLQKATEYAQTSLKNVKLGTTHIYISAKTEQQRDTTLLKWRKLVAKQFLSYYFSQLWLVFIEKIFAQPSLTSLCHDYTQKMPHFKLSNGTATLGACYINKNTKECAIAISHKVLSLPLEYIEFIIFHEFCHLIFQNHSKEYYALLSLFIPNHQTLKKSLKNLPK